MQYRFGRALLAFLIPVAFARAQESDAFARTLARSLPGVSRWLSLSAERLVVKPALARACDAAVARRDDRPDVAHVDFAAAPSVPWLAVGLMPRIDGLALSTSRNFTSIPLAFTLPATIDLSFDQFADSTREVDQRLRFADVGAMLSIPLAAGPARYGRLTFSAGAHVRFFDTEMRAGNGDEATQLIGCAGFSLSF